MKNLLFLVSLLISFLGWTQNNTNKTENTSDTIITSDDDTCILNNTIPEKGSFLDCFDTNTKLIKRMNEKELYITSDLINIENSPYIKKTENQSYIVTGLFENEKPYNGFFINENANNKEWLMYDFYKKGKLIYQLYNDMFTLLMNEDVYTDTKTLNLKNTFIDGVLYDGLEIDTDDLLMKGATIQIVRYVKKGKTDHFTLGFFAMHFGEVITIQPVENGYLFDSFSKNKVKITYDDTGYKIEYFDWNFTLKKTIRYIHYKFSDWNNVDKNKPFTYLRKNNTLYISQIEGPIQLPFQEEYQNEEEYDRNSDVIPYLLSGIYNNPHIIELNDIKYFLKYIKWADNDVLGYYMYKNGKKYSPFYTKGAIKNTFNLDFYTDGKLSNDFPVSIKNKTVNEIASLLKDIFYETIP